LRTWKLFKRFRKPPKAVLLFADDLTKALKKLSGTGDRLVVGIFESRIW